MKKTVILLLTLLLCGGGEVLGWGRSGHDAIAYIAECNLTPAAKARIEEYLGGRSMVYYASWMDEVRYSEPYRATSAWHGNLVDADGNYLPSEKGDAICCIEDCVRKLRDRRSLDDSTIVVSIRFLVHAVGDMHCPSHVKPPHYKNFDFDLNGKSCGFHSFWDGPALDMSHAWGYLEYAHQLDRCTEAQKAALAAGTPREWLSESARSCSPIYEWCVPDRRYDKAATSELLSRAHPLAEAQVLRAAYRLARILNGLFG